MYRWVPTITVSTRGLKNSGYGAVWKRTRAQTVREPLKCKCASTYIIYLCVMCVPIMMINNNNNNNIIQLVGSSLYCEWVPTRRHLWNMIRLQLLSLSYYYIVRGRRFYICVLHCVILCYALYWMKRSFKKTFCFFFYQVPSLYVCILCVIRASTCFRFVYTTYLSIRVRRRRGNNSKFLKVIFSVRPMGDNKRFFVLTRASFFFCSFWIFQFV